ncbi:MAG: hypothetical protein NTW45_10095 [Rhodocyclales bacterium]|nr:hypothetical protein [Rhodocyclales bacterium]
MANEQRNNIWPKVSAVGSVLSGTLIPLVIAYAANHVATTMKESENEIKFIEIATSIIREEPKENTSALRAWAVDVLVKNSKSVPLSASAQQQLKETRIAVSAYGWGNTTIYSNVNGTTVPAAADSTKQSKK